MTSGISTKVFIKINGTLHYLWRAVDQRGNVLDVLVDPRRNGNAASDSSVSAQRACSMCRG